MPPSGAFFASDFKKCLKRLFALFLSLGSTVFVVGLAGPLGRSKLPLVVHFLERATTALATSARPCHPHLASEKRLTLFGCALPTAL
jgi:hypothetical protein